MKTNLVALFNKKWLWLYLPVLCLSGFLLLQAIFVWYPLPPRSFVMVGNLPQGSHMEMSWRYRDLLELKGIQVNTLSVTGMQEPLQQLMNPQKQVDAAFVHGVLANRNLPNILALANIERQPVWIFTRKSNIRHLSHFSGLRIGASNDGQLTKSVISTLLQKAQLEYKDITLVAQDTASLATEDLLQDRTEILILIAGSESNNIRKLIRDPQINLIGIDSIASFTAREPRLKAFVIPQGAIDIRNNIPQNDMATLYTNLHLLVREQMHPALQRALLEAARDIHDSPRFLQRYGEYPNSQNMDFQPSPIALEWNKGQRPWLETVLPYWWAQLAELLIFAVIPIVLLTIFILMSITNLFSLKINAALQNFYGELKFLETDIQSTVSERPIEIKKLLENLDAIEEKLSAMNLPNRYAGRWYTLREDVARARERILTLRSR